MGEELAGQHSGIESCHCDGVGAGFDSAWVVVCGCGLSADTSRVCGTGDCGVVLHWEATVAGLGKAKLVDEVDVPREARQWKESGSMGACWFGVPTRRR